MNIANLTGHALQSPFTDGIRFLLLCVTNFTYALELYSRLTARGGTSMAGRIRNVVAALLGSKGDTPHQFRVYTIVKAVLYVYFRAVFAVSI